MATEAWQQLIYGEFTETMGIPMLANVSASSSVAENPDTMRRRRTIGWQPSKEFRTLLDAAGSVYGQVIACAAQFVIQPVE